MKHGNTGNRKLGKKNQYINIKTDQYRRKQKIDKINIKSTPKRIKAPKTEKTKPIKIKIP